MYVQEDDTNIEPLGVFDKLNVHNLPDALGTCYMTVHSICLMA